jgi:2-polyprenyl-3-methyl-5-hydroxy-6-metoxy-1,4-benzoquinol methylase
MRNTKFWNKEGVQKVFTHPICSEWIERLDRRSSVLDLGCGYGRLTPLLKRRGFLNIFGYDSSAPMIERAIRENPGATYTSRAELLSGKSFDLIICFALFTSCPDPDEQTGLVALINELSRENGLLYISDYETQDNLNYCSRYEQRILNLYGCFSSENAVFRHHEHGHFDHLMSGWARLEERSLSCKTLTGNNIVVHQYLYEKVNACIVI